jgi:hypothetical protein
MTTKKNKATNYVYNIRVQLIRRRERYSGVKQTRRFYIFLFSRFFNLIIFAHDYVATKKELREEKKRDEKK